MSTVYRFRLRGDVAADMAADNPVLAKNELGIEEDTGRAKLGNGVTGWNALPYLDELWPPHLQVSATAPVDPDPGDLWVQAII